LRHDLPVRYTIDRRVVPGRWSGAGLIRDGVASLQTWVTTLCTGAALVTRATMRTVSAIGWIAAVLVHRASVRFGSLTAPPRTLGAERPVDGRLPASSGHWWFAGRGPQSRGERTLTASTSYKLKRPGSEHCPRTMHLESPVYPGVRADMGKPYPNTPYPRRRPPKKSRKLPVNVLSPEFRMTR
jgi:hypothetical protein